MSLNKEVEDYNRDMLIFTLRPTLCKEMKQTCGDTCRFSFCIEELYEVKRGGQRTLQSLIKKNEKLSPYLLTLDQKIDIANNWLSKVLKDLR
jgi:hypothetical protein